jgi:hypothetical protein
LELINGRVLASSILIVIIPKVIWLYLQIPVGQWTYSTKVVSVLNRSQRRVSGTLVTHQKFRLSLTVSMFPAPSKGEGGNVTARIQRRHPFGIW